MSVNSLPGYVAWLKSNNTEKEFPVFIPSADVDYVTDGLMSATSLFEKYIVVGQSTPEEYQSHEQGARMFEERMNKMLSRDDLRVIEIKEIVNNSLDETVQDFQKFLKKYKRPTVLYFDPYDPTGFAEVFTTQTIQEYVDGGGKINSVQI